MKNKQKQGIRKNILNAEKDEINIKKIERRVEVDIRQ